MTINTDSLLHDFGRSTDRHIEAARAKIAPGVRDPKNAGDRPSPEKPVTAGTNETEEVK